MDAAQNHLSSRSATLYGRLMAADSDLSHAESLEVLDILIAALSALEERTSSSRFPAQPRCVSAS